MLTDAGTEPAAGETAAGRSRLPGGTYRSRWLPLVVVGFAAFIYLFRLSSPPALMFDEVYYARDARSYRLGATELTRDEYREIAACDRRQYPDGICSWVHPPLGKLLISAGERVGPLSCPSPTDDSGGASCSAFQWRLASALAGIVTVVLVLMLGFVLLRSWVWAAVAGGLVAVDGLILTSARIAMLDIFLVMFVVAGFLLLACDRLRGPAWWWQVGAGAAFGAAIAVKWAGVLALAGAWLLAIAWSVAVEENRGRGLARRLAGYALALVVVPMCVYAVVWVPYLATHGWSLGDLAGLHRSMAEYHFGLDVDHPYKSPAWQWPVLLRPTAYWFETTASGTSHVVNLGNPLFWWLSLPAVAAIAVHAVRRIHKPAAIVLAAGTVVVTTMAIAGIPFVAIGVAAFGVGVALAVLWLKDLDVLPALVLVGYTSLYVPWLVVPRPQFLFYLAPAVPIMALAWAWTARSIWEYRGSGPMRTTGRVFVIAAGVTTLIAFVLLYPVWTALPIPNGWWHVLMLVPSWI